MPSAINGNRSADFIVRSQRERMLRRVNNLIKDNKELSDALFILTENPLKVKKLLKNYTDKLNSIVLPYFDNVGVTKIVEQARKDFIKNMLQYTSRKNIEKNLISEAKLVNSVKDEYLQTVNSLIEGIDKNTATKNAQFILQTDAQKIKKEHIQDILLKSFDAEKHGIDVIGARASTSLTENQIQTALAADTSFVSVEGSLFSTDAVKKSWDGLTERYGEYDTVPFLKSRANPGLGTKNFPLRSYLDGKTVNMARESHNIATSIDSANAGVLTVKISSHGSTDSCSLHEGEIAFISDLAKETYISNFPEDKRAQSFRTIKEIQDDPTHMFGFNCKHIYTVWPIQWFDKSDRDEQVEDNPIKKIPKKINENQFKADAA